MYSWFMYEYRTIHPLHDKCVKCYRINVRAKQNRGVTINSMVFVMNIQIVENI